MDAASVRAWVASRRAAAEREREEERSARLSVESAVAAALALIALDGRLHGWPRADDRTGRSEDLHAWAQWARLRRVLGGG